MKRRPKWDRRAIGNRFKILLEICTYLHKQIAFEDLCQSLRKLRS